MPAGPLPVTKLSGTHQVLLYAPTSQVHLKSLLNGTWDTHPMCQIGRCWMHATGVDLKKQLAAWCGDRPNLLGKNVAERILLNFHQGVAISAAMATKSSSFCMAMSTALRNRCGVL